MKIDELTIYNAIRWTPGYSKILSFALGQFLCWVK